MQTCDTNAKRACVIGGPNNKKLRKIQTLIPITFVTSLASGSVVASAVPFDDGNVNVVVAEED
jgi:hypothetical protein